MQVTTKTQDSPVRQRSLVLSYLALRRIIGVIGIALPIVLVVGKIAFGSPGLLDSLSAYYYTVMRDVWVGSLCALGVFFFSYRYSWLDDVAGDLAGISAIGVALFPTSPANATPQELLIGQVHTGFGASLLLILAFFALVLFRKPDWQKKYTPRKRQRNRVYLLCGLIILACLALLGLMRFLTIPAWLPGLHPAFWLESLALWAFGLAWFIKGETLLKDKRPR